MIIHHHVYRTTLRTELQPDLFLDRRVNRRTVARRRRCTWRALQSDWSRLIEREFDIDVECAGETCAVEHHAVHARPEELRNLRERDRTSEESIGREHHAALRTLTGDRR